ncbi:hypothetical protein [Desulfogranum japonicum]|uniref:hypothetical protein n=1 Tax=Desulfogranum japonicum TaxID=231447 RepID=UPI001E5183D9|nr:hypothetical protein [Desulfogranum japonicum]
MGDTQRSPTISPVNQGIAEQDVPGNVPGGPGPTDDRPPALSGQASLEWIKVKARDEPQLVFSSLAHLISFDLLKRSYRQVRKSRSCAVLMGLRLLNMPNTWTRTSTVSCCGCNVVNTLLSRSSGFGSTRKAARRGR